MDNAIYVGLSRQVILQRALDIAANNIANADTAGFKAEEQLVQTYPMSPPPSASQAASPVKYVLDTGLARDFGQGPLDVTGNAMDVAIQGDGFFTVQTPNGPRYTRDGRFTTDAQGQLVDQAGDPVLNSGGAPIQLDPTKSAPSIGKDGTITQTDQRGQVTQVGKLGVVRFANPGQLSKSGDNGFTAPPGVTPMNAPDAVVHQGAVERSNVKPIAEITHLIEITRAYERVANMMTSTQDLSTRAVDQLGRMS